VAVACHRTGRWPAAGQGAGALPRSGAGRAALHCWYSAVQSAPRLLGGRASEVEDACSEREDDDGEEEDELVAE